MIKLLWYTMMEEGLSERLEITYGWHLKTSPGGPVGVDVGLDEREAPLPVRAGTDRFHG